MLIKSTFREIKSSIARYLAIFAIVALGVGFFSGLKMCRPSMIETAKEYIDSNKMYDYKLMSTYGVDDKSVKYAASQDGVKAAEGTIERDIVSDVDGTERLLKCISVPKDLNKIALADGRLPDKNNECVVDERMIKNGACKIGSDIELARSNKKSVRDEFKSQSFKIVGAVTSCLYLDYQRGSTDIGDGALDGYVYLNEDAFDTEYYTALYVKLDKEGETLSSSQKKILKSREDEMKFLAKTITSKRRAAVMAEAQEKLDDKKVEYEESLADYKESKTKAEKEIRDNEKKIRDGSKKLNASKKDLNAKLVKTKKQKKELQDSLASVKQAIAGLEAMGDTESDNYKALVTNKLKLQDSIIMCNSGIKKINGGLRTISSKQKELERAKKTLASEKKKAKAEFAKAEKKLDDAKDKLDDAQEEIDTMKMGKSYAFSREDNAGYSSFKSNSEIVDKIARIFPLFFFLIAILVCMTTMTRMVDEQRTQIGILKALGYSNGSILCKYLFYSGSSAAMGAVFGFFIGTNVFPRVIWQAYTMMYDFSDEVAFVFDPKLFALSIGAALVCALGATWLSVAENFGVQPAELIRPKTPPAGKRILLERITPVWNRMSFLYKVSFRNVFRYKKRFVMMVLGISGCTALLIAGFGLDTTVSKVADHQYSEISIYDYTVMFSDELDENQQQSFIKFGERKTDGKLGDVHFIHNTSADVSEGNAKIEGTCIATEAKDFDKFVDLHNGDDKVSFPGKGEAVISKKIQKALGAKVGDEITIKEGYRDMTVTVSGICDFYVGENVYVSTETYTDGMGKTPSIKGAYVRVPEGTSDAEIRDAATACGEYSKAAAVVVNLDMIESVQKMMESLNLVIYVVILCAGMLAFIVIFNLTNINIMERIREIATIKVLGFNRRETSKYVFRENIMLAGVASIVGIPLGRWLLDFCIDNIVVSMVFFETRITTLDYLYAVILTVVFTLIVNLAMGRRLDKVSMTESLKSIE